MSFSNIIDLVFRFLYEISFIIPIFLMNVEQRRPHQGDMAENGRAGVWIQVSEVGTCQTSYKVWEQNTGWPWTWPCCPSKHRDSGSTNDQLWLVWESKIISYPGNILGCLKRKIWAVLQPFTLWLSGKESACQCKRHRFDHWWGKISYSMVQVRPHTVTIEPML